MQRTHVGRETGEHPFPAIAAGIAGQPETLTAADAISLATRETIFSITQSGNQAFTLAAGTEGQEKTLFLATKGGAGNAVVTGLFNAANTTLTFDAVGELAVVKFLSGRWRVITNVGAVGVA